MGQEVPRGNVGEIVHRTPHAMLGYLHEPEKKHRHSAMDGFIAEI